MENPNETIYVTFVDEINQAKVRNFIAICSNIVEQMKPKTIYFLLSSPGGSVTDGITLYNFLKSLPVKIITHNIGSIDSIANVVFMAGEERYACPSCTFHLHGISIGINGSMLDLGKLNEIKSMVEKQHTQIAEIITKNTTITKREMSKLFIQGEAKDTVFALSKSIISEVREVNIPDGSPLITFNFN